jgi:mannan endo-1,4-beta-mannosidase
VLLGAYVPPAPEAGLQPVTDLEALIGRRLDIVHFFQAWDGLAARFRPDWLALAAAGGRRVLLTWEPWVPDQGHAQPAFGLAAIAHGRHDAYILAWAEGLRDFDQTVYLRPMHEMNGDWYPWAGGVRDNTPELYVAAWRRVRELVMAAGATKVRWVWSVNATDVPAGNRFERYWPGTDQVDVLGLDGYNWGGDMPAYGGWQSFDAIFGPSYARIVRLGPQPVWITETASDERGGDKAAWVRDMLASTALQRLQAIVWFNLRKERDWPMTSSRRAELAFSSDRGEPMAGHQ